MGELNSLQKLILTYRNRPSIWTTDILLRLSDPMASQIRDLRSTIVREVRRRRRRRFFLNFSKNLNTLTQMTGM